MSFDNSLRTIRLEKTNLRLFFFSVLDFGLAILFIVESCFNLCHESDKKDGDLCSGTSSERSGDIIARSQLKAL